MIHDDDSDFELLIQEKRKRAQRMARMRRREMWERSLSVSPNHSPISRAAATQSYNVMHNVSPFFPRRPHSAATEVRDPIAAANRSHSPVAAPPTNKWTKMHGILHKLHNASDEPRDVTTGSPGSVAHRRHSLPASPHHHAHLSPVVESEDMTSRADSPHSRHSVVTVHADAGGSREPSAEEQEEHTSFMKQKHASHSHETLDSRPSSAMTSHSSQSRHQTS